MITITNDDDDSEDDDDVLQLVLDQYCSVLITGDFYVSCGNSIVRFLTQFLFPMNSDVNKLY